MHSILATTLILLLLVDVLRGGVIFSDDFDAQPVGTLPKDWTLINNAAPSNATFAVARSADAPTAPNALQLANPLNGGFEVARFFPDVTLATGTTVVLSYALNAVQIPNGNTSANTGFTISLGKGSTGGFSHSFPAGNLRIFSAGDNPMAWVVLEGSQGRIITSSLMTRAFHPIRIEIKAGSTRAGAGTVTYFLHNREIGSFEFDAGTNAIINGIRINPQTGLGQPVPVEFWLDNVRVETKP
jgi:hypothetical protein